MDTLSKKWNFLAAMKLGEIYTVHNPPVNGIGKSGTQKYKDVTSAIWAMHRIYGSYRWVMRCVEDKINIVLVKTDEGSIEPPPVTDKTGKKHAAKIPEGPGMDLKMYDRLRSRKVRAKSNPAPVFPLKTELAKAEIAEEQRRTVAAIRPKAAMTDQQHLINMVRAHAVGQEIQHLIKGKWLLEPKPDFLDDPASYRIKPEPLREVFVLLSRDGTAIVNSALTRRELGHVDQQCVVHCREIPKEEEENDA